MNFSLKAEKTDIVLQQSRTNIYANFLAFFITASVFYPVIPMHFLVVWGVILIGVNSWRLFNISAISNSDDSDKKYHFLFISALLSGSSWGIFGFFLDHQWDHNYLLLSMFLISIVPASALGSLGTIPHIFRTFWLSLLIVLSIGNLLSNGLEHSLLPLFFLIFLLILQRFSNQNSQVLETSLDLKNHNQELLATIQKNHDILSKEHDEHQQQTELASQVFEKILATTDAPPDGIFLESIPLETLSGDYQLVKKTPSNTHYLLFTDFTGHGISASLGAVPTSLVFTSMASKGQPIANIMHEINRRLYELLPTNFFCCALLLEISTDGNQVSFINAGLPSTLFVDSQHQVKEIPSSTFPLGIVDDQDFSPHIITLALSKSDLLCVYSDGITESENPQGEELGIEKLIQLLKTRQLSDNPSKQICDDIKLFVDTAKQLDDMSIATIRGNC